MYMVDTMLSKLSEYRQRGGRTAPADITVKSGSFHHARGSTKLVVILPYWHARPSRYAGYRTRLHAKGISTLYYDLEPAMLQAHVERVALNFAEAADRIVDEVTALQVAFGLYELEINGFSLGNTLLGMVVPRFDTIDTLRMIVPGDDLAICMWRGIATKHIRLALENQGVSIGELADAWKPMSLIDYAPEMARKVPNIYVTLAKADKFIPYDRGRLFVDELQRCGADVHLQTWRMGHGAAVLRFIRTHKLDNTS